MQTRDNGTVAIYKRGWWWINYIQFLFYLYFHDVGSFSSFWKYIITRFFITRSYFLFEFLHNSFFSFDICIQVWTNFCNDMCNDVGNACTILVVGGHFIFPNTKTYESIQLSFITMLITCILVNLRWSYIIQLILRQR